MMSSWLLALLLLGAADAAPRGANRTAAALARGVAVGPVPESQAEFRRWFGLHCDVFGVHLFAHEDTELIKVQHACNVLAQWLDNDESGDPDNEKVIEALVSEKATVIMWPTDDGYEEVRRDFYDNMPTEGRTPPEYAYMSLTGEETIPYPEIPVPPGTRFDAAIEEILHLVTDCGYSKAYPEVFAGGNCACGHGEDAFAQPGESVLAQAMESVIGDCGFAFNGSYTFPNCTGWYHYVRTETSQLSSFATVVT